MAADKGKIGEAYVEIKADASQLKPSLDAVRKDVGETTDAIGRDANEKIGGGFENAGKKIEASTAGVRKLASAVSSVAGVFTSMVGVLGLIAGAIAGIVAVTERWFSSAKRTREETERALEVLLGAESSLARREAILKGASETELQILDIQQKSLDFERSLVAQVAKKVITQEEMIELRDRETEIARQEIKRVRELAAERKRLEEEAARESARRAKEKWDADREAMLDNLAKQRAAEEKAAQDRERRERESAQRQADALVASFDKAINTIRSRQIIDDSQLVGSLNKLNRTAEIMARNLQNLPIG